MKSTELEKQTNPPLLIASVRQSALLFRAWNRKLKEMFWFDLMWGSLHNKGTGWIGMLPIEQKGRKEIKSFTQSDDRIAIDPTNCEIMQFTGLKDKNDKDIYAGDIIKYFQPYANKWDTHIVLWDDKFAGFGMFEFNDKWCKESDWLKVKEIEIIGNIYENSELINGAF